jgi:hypothetical protein
MGLPARRAEHRLIRIRFVIGRIVSNPALNNQVRSGAAVRKCRHAETLRASSDRRFDLMQITMAGPLRGRSALCAPRFELGGLNENNENK